MSQVRLGLVDLSLAGGMVTLVLAAGALLRYRILTAGGELPDGVVARPGRAPLDPAPGSRADGDDSGLAHRPRVAVLAAAAVLFATILAWRPGASPTSSPSR